MKETASNLKCTVNWRRNINREAHIYMQTSAENIKKRRRLTGQHNFDKHYTYTTNVYTRVSQNKILVSKLQRSDQNQDATQRDEKIEIEITFFK